MSKLSPETEALLERGRAGKPLTAAHQARLKTAILAKATGAATSTTTASAAGWMGPTFWLERDVRGDIQGRA